MATTLALLVATWRQLSILMSDEGYCRSRAAARNKRVINELCRQSFTLLRYSIMSTRGTRSSRHHTATAYPINLQLAEGHSLTSNHSICPCIVYLPSAHMCSEGYSSCPMYVCPRSNLPPHTLESQKRDTNGFIAIRE